MDSMYTNPPAGLLSLQPRRLSFSMATSVAIDVLVLAFFVFASRHGRTADTHPLEMPAKGLIWLVQPGPGGGGGGGGNRMKEPPRHAELPGKDALTVPVETQPNVQPQARIEP